VKVGQNEIVNAIHVRSNKEIWLGTIGSGVRVYKDSQLIHSFTNDGIMHAGRILEDKKGKVWVATNRGLYTFFQNKWKRVFKEISNVYTMAIDSKDRILLTSWNGILYWIEDEQIKETIPLKQQIMQIIFDPVADRFIVAYQNGIRFFANGKLSENNLITTPAISVAVLRDSSLVIGTPGYGIEIIRGSKRKKITTKEGLTDDYIYFIIADQSFVWLGTNNGIDKIGLDSGLNIQSLEHFDQYSGFDELECNLGAFFKNDSSLYVGLVSGAYRYIPRSAEGKTPTHPLHFTKVNFLDEDQNSISDSLLQNTSEFVIHYPYNHLAFAVNTVSQTHSDEFYYTARLEGPVQIKTAPQKGNEFDYAHLPPGNYRLVVGAIDRSNLHVNNQISLQFSIIPAFHQTLWFKISLALFVILVVILVIRIQQRRKYRKLVTQSQIREEEEQKLRKEIAGDFHDELGNELARMSNYLILLKLKNEVKSDIYENLFRNTQKILIGTKDFIWTLDSANNDISNIVIHLKDFGERLFAEKKIDFSFLGVIPEGLKVPTGYSRQINLIFKEAMTNTFRHSHATEVSFGITREQNKITLFLKDNGKGIPPDLDNPTGGLVNMRARAKKIDADFYLKSDYTETFIALTFKV
jgi:signal transduction histidine kinase